MLRVSCLDRVSVVSDVSRCRCAEDAAGCDIEDGAVQGAGDLCPLNDTFGERSTPMGTRVVNRVVGSLDVEDRDASRCNVHRLGLTRSDVARFGDL
jgi:hypothetical protein